MSTEQTDITNRKAILYASPQLIASLCSGTYQVVADVLPGDATVVGAGYDDAMNTFYVVLQSIEFMAVVDGANYPVLPLVMLRRVDVPDKSKCVTEWGVPQI